jgi:hypothetical protein
MHLSTSDPKQLNVIMARHVPELASEYARFPMKLDRWRKGNEKGFKGEKLYLKSPNEGLKTDYVYGTGPYGRGYYSLLCKNSYESLFARVMSEMPSGCCAFGAAARKQCDEWDDVKRIVHARSVASVPDDAIAFGDALAASRQFANDYGMFLGTQAIATTTVNAMNPL